LIAADKFANVIIIIVVIVVNHHRSSYSHNGTSCSVRRYITIRGRKSGIPAQPTGVTSVSVPVI